MNYIIWSSQLNSTGENTTLISRYMYYVNTFLIKNILVETFHIPKAYSLNCTTGAPVCRGRSNGQDLGLHTRHIAMSGGKGFLCFPLLSTRCGRWMCLGGGGGVPLLRERWFTDYEEWRARTGQRVYRPETDYVNRKKNLRASGCLGRQHIKKGKGLPSFCVILISLRLCETPSSSRQHQSEEGTYLRSQRVLIN